MNYIMSVILIGVLGIPFILGGTIVLQVYLSKKDNKYPGLVLPGIIGTSAILLTLIITMNMMEMNGEIIVSMILLCLVLLIPTFILLLIYFLIRSSKNNKSQVQKMKIRDL